ncbi:MAG: hypothetical protein ACTHNZ_13100 [Trinickia sp.]|uniref:hypothetical protein n=1 Tax=Trinickia sp. TaxID=2571163 RepID=UPI003F813C84
MDDVSVLVGVLSRLSRGLISFDGCDGAGKTRLACDISRALGHEAIDFDQFLTRQTGEFFKALRLPELKQQIGEALTRSPIVLLSGACMREVLAALNRVAAASVYVQRITQAGLPSDMDFIDVESGIEASADVLANFSVLDHEIYAYHRQHRPRTNADVVFNRRAE